MLILGWSVAYALDLPAAVLRAGEVDPQVVIAELQRRAEGAAVAASWSALLPTPTWSTDIPLSEAPRTTSINVSLPLFAPVDWLTISERHAGLRTAGHRAEATRIDTEYAAAVLYYSALAADEAVAVASESLALAEASFAAARARREAGLDNELALKASELGVVNARADSFSARAAAKNAIARLERALQQEVDSLSPAAPPVVPELGGRSPWIDAAEARAEQYKRAYYADLGAMLPTAELDARPSLSVAGSNAWALTVQASWTLDGVLGPWLEVRQSYFTARIAEVERDAVDDDVTLGLRVAQEDVRAARELVEVARARESLLEAAFGVGRARQVAGLESTLEVLRIQDDVARARLDRVNAELYETVLILELRRLSGLSPA